MTVRRIGRIVGALLAATLMLIMCGPIPIPVGEAAAKTSLAPVIIVMDTSSSMSEQASGSSSTRIEKAREAVISTVEKMGDSVDFGLLAYPGSGRNQIEGCSSGDVEVPIGQLRSSDVSSAVRRLTPSGDTPTGPALRHAAKLIKDAGGKGTIVLVSDGESNCGTTDTCEVARELNASGTQVTAHTVGFEISDEGRSELECIANALHGDFVDITNGDDLGDAVAKSAGPRLEYSGHDVTMPTVVGEGVHGNTYRVKLKNTGSVAAGDVRVSLDFRSASGAPSALPVAVPIQFLGNIAPDAPERTVDFTVRPPVGSEGRYTANVYVSSPDTRPTYKSYRAEVQKNELLTGLLGKVRHPVILGDSYSSGEGAGDYVKGTTGRGGDNNCHRSNSSYGQVLFQRKATNLACSGAVTADFYARQNRDDVAVPPQLFELRKLVEKGGSDRPDGVVMSVGGNDIGFGSIAKSCLATLATCWLGTNDVKGKTDVLFNDLLRVYRDVDRAINDDAVGRRGRADAPIVIVPYPRITPTNQRIDEITRQKPLFNEADFCAGLLTHTSTKILNGVIDTLNKTIRNAVTVMHDSGRPFYFADDVIEAFQTSHTLCDGDASYAVNVHELGTLHPEKYFQGVQAQEIAHPNKKGYETMAAAIRTWSGATPLEDTKGKAIYWDSAKKKDPGLFESLADEALIEPIKELFTQAGGTKKILADAYLPGSTVRLYTHSFPRLVGTATVDAEGRVHTTVAIPTDLLPGSHRVEVVGIGKDGKIRTYSEDIYVMPRYTSFVMIGMIVGLVLVGYGAISLRRAKKRRRASTPTAGPTPVA